MAGTHRKSQSRSTVTREAILNAAVECLAEHGYERTTTSEIANRAGVSRGAQLHHFPSKSDLMASAVEHIMARRVIEFRQLFTGRGLSFESLDPLLDQLWNMFQGPTFIAFTELWIAARTKPDLARAIVDVERRFTDETRLLAVELIGGLDLYDPWAIEMMRDFAFAVMTGVAFQRLVPRGQRPAADYLEVLKSAAPAFLAGYLVAPSSS